MRYYVFSAEKKKTSNLYDTELFARFSGLFYKVPDDRHRAQHRQIFKFIFHLEVPEWFGNG